MLQEDLYTPPHIPQKLLDAEAFHRGTRDFGSTMDGFCDQQVPFMVPGVSLRLCCFVPELFGVEARVGPPLHPFSCT